MLSSAYSYFAMKATGEVRHFLGKGKYQNITREVDGILYYSGRILEDYEFGGYPDLCSAALDLCSTTFCVPVMESFSPVAIAVALEIHWFHPDVGHKGIEGILRQMLRVAHIIGGRQLAVSLKDGCKKCRILYKRSVDVPFKTSTFVSLHRFMLPRWIFLALLRLILALTNELRSRFGFRYFVAPPQGP